MKKTAIFFTVMLALYACGNGGADAGPGISPSATPLDLTAFTLRDIPGTDLKKAERFNENGRVMEEGVLRGGKRNGTWIVYNETKDVPKSVVSFVDDVLNGPYLDYNKHGQLELMCAYSNNVLDGQFVRYHSSRKTETGYYKNGKLDGIYKKYYDRKDAVQMEAEYKEGLMDGKVRYFNEAGDVIMEYDYERGEKTGGGIVDNTAMNQ